MTTPGVYFVTLPPLFSDETLLSLCHTKSLSVSGAGCPKSPVEASFSENDNGSDPVSVHLHLQGPHPVPPQLQAHISTSVCPGQHAQSSQMIVGWSLPQVYAKLHCEDAAA